MRVDESAHPVHKYVRGDGLKNLFRRYRKIWQNFCHLMSFKSGHRNWFKIGFSHAVLVSLFLTISSILQHIMFATLLIEHQFESPATTLYFTRNRRMKKELCLKIWQRRKHGKNSSEDEVRDIDNLIEGLQFNCRFAPGIYLGLALVKGPDQKSGIIQHGWILKSWMIRSRIARQWIKDRIREGVIFVLVMKRLPEKWRLDHQWQLERIGTPEGMEFLAKEIARMHRHLKRSPRGVGTFGQISAKRTLNTTLFREGLHQLATSSEDITKDEYRSIETLLDQACNDYHNLFEERYQGNHIRRCHGDLKTTNLWICPKNSFLGGLKKTSQCLIALDCVDFRPDFCHIDTLSDVALLAVDLEVRLSLNFDKDTKADSGMELAKHFLSCYLQNVGDSSESSLRLLEYYMVEKAMVCTYVSLLFDHLPELGKKYLSIALFHAQSLEKLRLSQQKKQADYNCFLQEKSGSSQNLGNSACLLQ